MKRKIYLMRHGNPGEEGNPRRCLGTTDVSLSDNGKKQLYKYKNFVNGLGWKKVYVSPMKRCRQTAECLGIGQSDAIVKDDLREMAGGIWENLPFSEIKEKYPDLYEARGKAFGTFAVEGAESFFKAGKRFAKCMDEIRKESEEDILVIAHAGVIRGYLCLLCGKSLDYVMDFSIPYGGITILEETEGNLMIEVVGILPIEALDGEAIKGFYRECKTPEPVILHMKKVAEVVLQIMKESQAPGLFDESEIELVYKAALLHDVRRTEKNHATKSAEYIRKKGYPQIANLIVMHHSDVLSAKNKLELHEILFYADKLVQGDRIVSIEERFEKSFEKCKGIPEAEEKHHRLYQKTIEIEKKLDENLLINNNENLIIKRNDCC